MSDNITSATIVISAGKSVGHHTLYPYSWTVAPSGLSGFDVSMPDCRDVAAMLRRQLLGLIYPASSVMSAPVPSDLTACGVCGTCRLTYAATAQPPENIAPSRLL